MRSASVPVLHLNRMTASVPFTFHLYHSSSFSVFLSFLDSCACPAVRSVHLLVPMHRLVWRHSRSSTILSTFTIGLLAWSSPHDRQSFHLSLKSGDSRSISTATPKSGLAFAPSAWRGLVRLSSKLANLQDIIQLPDLDKIALDSELAESQR